MFLKYNGKTENFKYKDIDFSKGPAEVDDALGAKMLKYNPMTFTQVVPTKPEAPKATEASKKPTKK